MPGPSSTPARFGRLALLVALLVIAHRPARPDDLPPEPADRRPSYEVAPAAEAFVARFGRADLLKDEVFVRALEELARGDLGPAAKADAFALMQRQIGWLFAGVAPQFPGMGYAQSQAMVLSTYVGYQQKLPANLDVGPLLDLARSARAEHPLRASNALLLATLLNRAAAHDPVRRAIDWAEVAAAPVPAIDLHNLALAAALTCDPRVVADVVALLPRVESEEGREDLVVITGIFSDEGLREQVEGFVRAEFPGRFDCAVRSALQVLVHGSPPEHFRTFYKSLADGKGPRDVATLRKFWDDKFEAAPPPGAAGGTFLKIWDGFTFAVEADGGWVTFGPTFRAWHRFR